MAEPQGGNVTIGQLLREWIDFDAARQRKSFAPQIESQLAAAWVKVRKAVYQSTIDVSAEPKTGKELDEFSVDNTWLMTEPVMKEYRALQTIIAQTN